MAIDVAGRTRIPDGVTPEALTEIKNVAYQSLTQQIRDYLQFAQTTGRRFDLFVRSNTTLSKPLQDLVNSGQIRLRSIPGT